MQAEASADLTKKQGLLDSLGFPEPSLIITQGLKKTDYQDLRFPGSKQELKEAIEKSTTLYVGNLSFYTTEEQIYELFSLSGEIKRIIMGLDRYKRTPCGFCFVEFYTQKDAHDCLKYISGTKLDDRIIRCDWDAGFIEGRQFGRGKSGGQVRDEHRQDYDPGRGGYGSRSIDNLMTRYKKRSSEVQ